MSRIAYVDGRYLPITAATVSIEDRGFQFADSIYEVLKRIGGRLVDADRHLARLRRSLAELRIEPPCSDAALRRIDEGEYGWCEVTGEPIGIHRLIARPIATMTVEAQQAHERREKVSRDD